MPPPLKSVLSLVLAPLLLSCGPTPARPRGPDPLSPPPAAVPAALSVLPGPRAERASPAPSASPSPDEGDWRQGDLIAFEAPQRPGALQRDLFIYQARLDTVLAVVAANSPADESSPKLSRDRRWLAFKRTVSHAPHAPRADLLLLDTLTQRLHTLPGLNAAAAEETEPELSGDGRWLAYVSHEGGRFRLGLYDVALGAAYALPGADRGFAEVHNPRFFDQDRRIAFSARPAAPSGEAPTLDIFVYDLPSGSLYTPPFVNTPHNEDNPDISRDGRRMLFDSDRFGSRDLFEANLETGATDDLAFANTAAFDERSGRYYGPDDAWIRYKRFPAPGGYALRIYRRASGEVDTLPIPNRVLEGSP
jgi:hypothetical protein